jgi:putative polyketide hydroxylase
MLAWHDSDSSSSEPDEISQRDRVRKAAGLDLPDDDITLITTEKWDIGGYIADRFSSGRILLAGDSAHTLRPSRGGYGANTGIADAHNMAWKLAAVLSGRSSLALLETYDAELRFVAQTRHDLIIAREDHRRFVRDRDWEGKNVDRLDDVSMEFGQRYISDIIIVSNAGSRITSRSTAGGVEGLTRDKSTSCSAQRNPGRADLYATTLWRDLGCGLNRRFMETSA